MNLPFTVRQFFGVFESYNTAIWPAQVVAYILGFIVAVVVFRGGRLQSKIVTPVLSTFWLWMGIVYHIMYFSAINPAARLFGVLFILQGALLGVVSPRLAFQFRLKPIPLVGALMITYAMILYPLLGSLCGHSYPASPVFGVAPCPTTIFTFGILLLAESTVPVYIIIIPLLWSVIGLMAAVNLQVPQDYGLGAAGGLGSFLIVANNRAYRSPKAKRR